MEKSADAFRTISEVADYLETPAHVLRFWESRFPQIKPVKRAGGRRYYRPNDVALLTGIKRLLHDEGVTIRGVQKILREQGVRHVAGIAGDAPADHDAADMLEAVFAKTVGARNGSVPAEPATSAKVVPITSPFTRPPAPQPPAPQPDLFATTAEAALPDTDAADAPFAEVDGDEAVDEDMLAVLANQSGAAPLAPLILQPVALVPDGPVDDIRLSITARLRHARRIDHADVRDDLRFLRLRLQGLRDRLADATRTAAH